MNLHWTRKIGRRLPRPVRTAGALGIYATQVLAKARGVYPRECPCCGYSGWFAMFGHPPRYDARCPQCGSNERQRLIALALQSHGRPNGADRVLYFTPEPPMIDYLRKRVGDFQSVSLKDPDRIDAEDGAFDLVIASNVLEHVEDEQRYLAEIRRVLSDTGHFLATVPMVAGWDATYENPSVEAASARLAHFGQTNHLRLYGRDVAGRIRRAGFDVDEHIALGAESVRFSLVPGERALVAAKAALQA